MLSVGRRGELLKGFKKLISSESKIDATDISSYAPPLYMADKQYLVPCIDEPPYIDKILDICRTKKLCSNYLY